MESIRFTLSGNFAFFKKPETNQVYFTYAHIHKVALLGILGAILGLNGYNQQQETDCFPEFYEQLKDLQIAIVPEWDASKPSGFRKSYHTTTNTTGFFNRDGATLLVKQQWLDNPKWRIYLQESENPYYERLKEALLNNKSVFPPYLGANGHAANITEVQVLQLEENQGTTRLHSLAKVEDVLEIVTPIRKVKQSGVTHTWREKLPLGLSEVLNQYISQDFLLTNQMVKVAKYYTDSDTHIVFM